MAVAIAPPAPPTPTAAVPLTTLRPGTTVTLGEVRDPATRGVLRSLGLTDACRVRVLKLGDPCIVQVRSTRIGLSRTVAQHVSVIPDERDRP